MIVFARASPYLRADMDRHGISAAAGADHVLTTLHEAVATVHAVLALQPPDRPASGSAAGLSRTTSRHGSLFAAADRPGGSALPGFRRGRVDPACLDRRQEAVPILLGLVRVGHGKCADHLLECVAGAGISGHQGRVAGPSMRPRERAAAERGVERQRLLKSGSDMASRESLNRRM